MSEIIIIGGGLAGSEAAWQAANQGIKIKLYEMRDANTKTFAHQTDNLAELVCSNSFRSDDAANSAIGLLHQEMRKLDSLIIQCADKSKVPAGGALAVDRDNFSKLVTEAIIKHPNIELCREEIVNLEQFKNKKLIIATGPLTSDGLSAEILKLTGEESLAFFDAIAPIIYKDSIDFDKAWYQSRYDKIGPEGDGKDYINCPLSKEQYEKFINDLIEAEKTEFKEWEKNTPYFNGCLPIEVMAERGIQTLRFGPMKPVGLTNKHQPTVKPYAIVQLRQDNKEATLYNIVGFQTKMIYSEQVRIFKTIPGLENAVFARLGGIHRNTFINSPKLLDKYLTLKNRPDISFAGQITGVEGYVESAACGLACGIFTAAKISGKNINYPHKNTALGSMLNYITASANQDSFQPMNVNFGLFEDIENYNKKNSKISKKELYCNRAVENFKPLYT